MPFLRDELLNPISGPNPSGDDLRYSPLRDRIKEAATEDKDDGPVGDWSRERKRADHNAVIKLASEVLLTKSKDLEIACWLVFSGIKKEGLAALPAALEFLQALTDRFWDTLHPVLEEGDAELRAMPFEWLSARISEYAREAPLTRSGLSWIKYRESRAVGYEADATTDDKLSARQQAIEDGKTTADEFDAALKSTPKAYVQALWDGLDQSLTKLRELDSFCEQKFGSTSPSFARMRSGLEELKQLVHVLLATKREHEPDPDEINASPEESEEAVPEVMTAASSGAAVKRARAPAAASEPRDLEDADARILGAAAYLRREQPDNPVSYLLLRALRWGELRALADSMDAALEPPDTDTRVRIRAWYAEGNWEQLIEASETAMSKPCGRGWLDVQRFSWSACNELGRYNVSAALVAETRTLLQQFPELADKDLLDGTPAAGNETKEWIRHTVLAGGGDTPSDQDSIVTHESVEDQVDTGEPDVFDTALEYSRAGRPAEGIQLLTEEISREASGRGRFQRRLQLAELCLNAGYEMVAYPILQQLAAEIEERHLEDWEAKQMTAQPLALFVRCLDKVDRNGAEKQSAYSRLCRIDPVLAMRVGR